MLIKNIARCGFRGGVSLVNKILTHEGGHLTLKSSMDHQEQALTIIDAYIKNIKPLRVLELGSGNGYNLKRLAEMNPQVPEWVGVEYTQAGIDCSPVLPRVKFVRGSVLDLKFPDNSFDFVFSHLVIEQLPNDYLQAFKEAGRVTASHACFIEEFKEAQKDIFQLINLKIRNYFCQSYKVVESAGLKILKFDTLTFDKTSHSHGVVLCRKDTDFTVNS